MSKKKFSFLIVNYNSEQYLEDCISSIFKKHPGDGFEIIVINNNDKGDFQSSVCARHSNIRLINNNENIGFGRAHNIGAQESQGDILVILNPDAHFTSIDFAEILSRFERENDLGIIAPRIVDEKGDDQKWSAGRKITPWGIIRNNANLSKDRNPLNQKQESEVDWVTGAAFFIKKDTFEKIGGFDENFFMYFEDIDLCHRIRKNGGRIIRLPSAKVTHLSGKSYTNKSQQKKDYYRSQDYYLRKHFGAGPSFGLRLIRKLFS